MVTVNLTGRLTRDPELGLVSTNAGDRVAVCHLRVAARDRRGDVVYLDLAEWGAPGRAAAERLRMGSLIAFSGELRFREQRDDSGTRSFLSAVGHVEFLDGRGASSASGPEAGASAATADVAGRASGPAS